MTESDQRQSERSINMTGEYRFRRRVEFAETDMAGIVHFSNFFRYMEMAEHDFLRSIGLSVHADIDGRTVSWPRVRAECSYHAPATFEDELEIVVTVREKRTKTADLRFPLLQRGRGTDRQRYDDRGLRRHRSGDAEDDVDSHPGVYRPQDRNDIHEHNSSLIFALKMSHTLAVSEVVGGRGPVRLARMVNRIDGQIGSTRRRVQPCLASNRSHHPDKPDGVGLRRALSGLQSFSPSGQAGWSRFGAAPLSGLQSFSPSGQAGWSRFGARAVVWPSIVLTIRTSTPAATNGSFSMQRSIKEKQMPTPETNQSSLAWLLYAGITVAAWGVYGIFLHSGQMTMKDPESGRYKAFLFVGVAYFLTAVLAPLAVLWLKGAILVLYARGHGMVACGGDSRGDRRVQRTAGFQRRRAAQRGDDDRVRGCTDRQRPGRPVDAPARRRLVRPSLAVRPGHRPGGPRGCLGDPLQAGPGKSPHTAAPKQVASPGAGPDSPARGIPPQDNLRWSDVSIHATDRDTDGG